MFEYPKITQDFFPLLRHWYERSCRIADWQKLRLVMSYSTENYISLDINQSPFNVGSTILLPKFSYEQTIDLAMRLRWGGKEKNWQENILDVHNLVGGHPYLINLALYYLTQTSDSIESLLSNAPTTQGIYNQYLHKISMLIESKPALKKNLIQLIIAKDSTKIDLLDAYYLESLGLVTRKRNMVKISCDLYRLYFKDLLIFKNNLS